MAKKNRLVWTDDVMSFLCKRCNEMYPDEPCEHSDCLMLEELDKCKTVDAVEVVRCKDCKNYFYSSFSMGMKCRLDGTEWGKDDFCSCGERKDNGTSKSDK